MKTLKVILPTLNEEKAVVKVIKTIPYDGIKRLGYETSVLVIDGGSKDRTVRRAREQGVEVIKQEGKGKGSAIRTAFKKLKNNPPTITVMLDADNTYDPQEIPKMILPLIVGEADVTIGSRQGRTHYIGNAILTGLANKAFKSNTEDLCTGYWGFNIKAIRNIDIKAKGFDLETDLFAQVNKNKLVMKSVNIKYRKRIGESKLTRKDSLRIIGRLIRNIRDWNPMFLFGVMGLTSIIFAFFFGLNVIQDYLNNGFVVAIGSFLLTIFLGIMGFFLIFMGLILDLLERKSESF